MIAFSNSKFKFIEKITYEILFQIISNRIRRWEIIRNSQVIFNSLFAQDQQIESIKMNNGSINDMLI
jgi:hypothetical protein